MTIAFILMIILCLVCMTISVIAVFVAWKSLVSALASEAQKDEYRLFMRASINTIQDHSQIFRTELARRMSLDIPQVKDLNSMLQKLEVSMVSFRESLEKFVLEEGE